MISEVGALKRRTVVVKLRDRDDPSTSHNSPGRSEYKAVTLKSGLT